MIVLDTHALIWWVSGEAKLSKAAVKAIEKEKKNSGTIFVSSISVWEIYLLVKRGRLILTMDLSAWVAKIETLPYVQFVSVDNNIAAKSVLLPGNFHDDPADRMIVATAREKGAALVTADGRIRKYSHVQTIW